ncbi:alpha/beta fold hydrolase [Microbacterium sp. JB110]|uniref:alpha/beta fold hydrolase n=1 Tax=Microbacterium sp. JB110 TaxID=2024477 RepID=UPI000B351E9E|nr:alpha/beta fold hydrolase [Microbacterium sp. JB110]RCS62122.1 alpha/beta fold hydrolase [Microbacterium sp. JB110]
MSDQTVVFLHGIGAGPQSWDAQLSALPAGMAGVAVQLPGLRDGDTATFSLPAAARAVRDELDKRDAQVAHLCGLSLGAMVATWFALDYPERVASLVISGGQVHPNPVLMGVHGAIMRVLPSRMVTAPGMSKKPLLGVLDTIRRVDFRGELARIAAPTLVLCGSKDRPNLPAARQLAVGIPGAQLQIVPGAGHEWNTQMPDEFSARLGMFYSQHTG